MIIIIYIINQHLLLTNYKVSITFVTSTMCNIKQSKDTSASINNMDSSDMDSTDVEGNSSSI